MDGRKSPDYMPLFSFPPRFSQPTSSPGRSAFSTDAVGRSSVPSSASKPPESPHSSRSISTDPCSLFSSPMQRYPSPPATSSQNRVELSNMTFPGRAAIQSSPLTPLSSPPHYQTRFSSTDELQLVSPVRYSSTTSISNTRPTDTLIEVSDAPIPEDTEPHLVRYSLRRRDPRQLNPYVYDKLMYKQQMRSNPDAIVKFRSPRRKSHGQPEEEDTQLAYCPPDNPDEDGDYVETIPKPRRGTSSTGPDHVDEAPDIGWLPEALRPLSSSDEDNDEIRKLAKKARREREKTEANNRAAAKKAEAEARKARLEARKPTMKRRAFPIPSPSVRSTLSSQRGVSLVRYSLLRLLVSGLTFSGTTFA